VSARRAIACTAAELQSPAATGAGEESSTARVICTRSGAPWLVTVVARVISEDVKSGATGGRLILHFESMHHPERYARIASIRTLDLELASEEELRAALARRSSSADAR
jgi:hypothetical protein